MKNKLAVLSLASILLLGACQNDVPSSSAGSSEIGDESSSNEIKDNTSSEETKDSTGGEVNPEKAKFTLEMNGELRLNQSRSIYAILKEGQTGTVKFSSSDPNVIRASEMSGVTNEALLSAVGEGSATISAYLEGEEDILVTKEITIAHGQVLPQETFNKLTSGMKVSSTQKLFDYDEKLNPTLNSQFDITTIYEENSDMETYHGTDAYQIDVINHATGKNTFSRKYVRNGVRLAVEQLTKDNTISKITQFSDEGDEYNWVNSYYENLFFTDEENGGTPTVQASDFETFDDGASYEYVGKNLWATTYLTVSLVMEDITPDEFKITVDGDNLGFHIVTDPFAKDGETKGGQVIDSTISEIGTATIDHIQPFAHETYHDQLEVARLELANSKNYTSTYTLKDSDNEITTYTLTYTEDTVEEKIVDSTGKIIAHDGAHREGNGYITYNYDDSTGTLTKKKSYEASFDSVNRYPTFDFAIEVLGEGKNGVYTSRGDYTGDFIGYCWNLPKYCTYYTVNGDTQVTMENGHLTGMKATLASSTLADEIKFEGTFSNIGTTTINYDWSQIETPDEPTNYEGTLLTYLQAWGVEDIIPFLYPTNTGYRDWEVSRTYWKDSSGHMDYNYAKYAYFRTNDFENSTQRDAYITNYKALLVENGWTLSEEEDANLGYIYYVSQDGEWKLSVGPNRNWSGGSATNAVCFTFTNKTNKMAMPDIYNDSDY